MYFLKKTGSPYEITIVGFLIVEQGATLTIENIGGIGLYTDGEVSIDGTLIVNNTSGEGIKNSSSGTFLSGANSNITITGSDNDGFENEGTVNLLGDLMLDDILVNGILNFSQFKVSGIVDITTGSSSAIWNASGDFNFILTANADLESSSGSGAILNQSNMNIDCPLEINLVGSDAKGIRNSGTLSTEEHLEINANGNVAVDNVSAGIIEIEQCGLLDIDGQIQTSNSGNWENNGLIITQYDDVHDLGNNFTILNNGLIWDMDQAFLGSYSQITNNGGAILVPRATYPTGPIDPFYFGNPPYNVTLVNNELTSGVKVLTVGMVYFNSHVVHMSCLLR